MEKTINIREVTKEYMENCYFKTIFNEVFESIIWFFTFYPFIAMINYFKVKDIREVFTGVVVIIPIIIAVVLKKRLKVAWQSFLTYSMLYLISAIVLQLIFKSWSYGVFLIPWFIKDLKKSKLVEKVNFNKNSIVAIEVILAFSMLICAVLKLKEIRKIIFFLAISIGIISIAYLHKIRTDRLLVKDNIKRNVVSISNKYGKNIIIALCIAALIIVMFIIGTLGAFNKAAAMTDKIAEVITNGFGEVEVKDQHTSEAGELSKNGFNGLNNEAKEPSGIVKVIFMILRFILTIITFLLKIFIVIALMSMIYLIFNFMLLKLKTKNNTDEIEYIHNSSKKEEKLIERFKKYKDEIKEFITYDNKKEIRRLFKKKVLKYKGKKVIIRNTFTVEEINNEIKENTKEDLKKISNIYEKARYSKEDINESEVSYFKNNI